MQEIERGAWGSTWLIHTESFADLGDELATPREGGVGQGGVSEAYWEWVGGGEERGGGQRSLQATSIDLLHRHLMHGSRHSLRV